jgi:hypothetical protein
LQFKSLKIKKRGFRQKMKFFIVLMAAILVSKESATNHTESSQIAELPDWFQNWLVELKSLFEFIKSISIIFWNVNIQPLTEKIKDQIKTGQIDVPTFVGELVDLFKNIARLIIIDTFELIFGLSTRLDDLLKLIWSHLFNN